MQSAAWILVSAILVAQVQPPGSAMRIPFTDKVPSERPVAKAEVEALPCTRRIRLEASTFPGFVDGSEKVFYSDEFGYVYRYKTSNNIEAPTGETYRVQSIFVIWTPDDCKSLRFATFAGGDVQKLSEGPHGSSP